MLSIANRSAATYKNLSVDSNRFSGTIHPMNKTTKNEAKAMSLRSYLLADKRFLTPAPNRNRMVKRTITRMMRRVNRALCVA